MRPLALILCLPVAACATVEQRTDARSGAGFASQTVDNAPAPADGQTEIEMVGLETVPVIAVAGVPGDVSGSAGAAIGAGDSGSGEWSRFTLGGNAYALRQVQSGGFQFAVADPQNPGEVSPMLSTEAAVRTGCKSTGQSWRGNDMIAIGLNCS